MKDIVKVTNEQDLSARDEWRELNKLLNLVVALLAIGAAFCLLRVTFRVAALSVLADACRVSQGRVLEIGLHYNAELRSGSLSVCEVACAKLFSESSSALLTALLAGLLIVAPWRARRLTKTLRVICGSDRN